MKAEKESLKTRATKNKADLNSLESQLKENKLAQE